MSCASTCPGVYEQNESGDYQVTRCGEECDNGAGHSGDHHCGGGHTWANEIGTFD